MVYIHISLTKESNAHKKRAKRIKPNDYGIIEIKGVHY